VKTAHRNLVEAGPDKHSLVGGGLNENFTFSMQCGKEIASIKRHQKFSDVR
jgi:hypothetical protein